MVNPTSKATMVHVSWIIFISFILIRPGFCKDSSEEKRINLQIAVICVLLLLLCFNIAIVFFICYRKMTKDISERKEKNVETGIAKPQVSSSASEVYPSQEKVVATHEAYNYDDYVLPQ